MALGLHWEWRGFGAVSGRFARRFCELAPKYDPQDVEDVYLWVPGLKVNVKVRDIPQEPFKFKRLQDTDGHLEQWAENPEDVFRFPLNEAGWNHLAEVLAAVNVTLGPYPSGEADAETTLARLKEAGARTITVHKLRESRLWQGPNGKVIVEWACISSPEAIVSIGLETWDEDPKGQGLPDEQAKEDIRAAIKALGLDNESVRAMNYMDAVAVWASGKNIHPTL
jgi:hypothetical protein